MRLEYIIISMVIFIVLLLAIVLFVGGAPEGFRAAIQNLTCGLGLC